MTEQQVVSKRTEQPRPTKRAVLVPLDGSDLGDRILPHVERLLGREPYAVVLLRIVPPAATDDRPPGELHRDRDQAESHLWTVRRRLEGLGAGVTTLLREGDPAAEILFAIDELQPAIVAMSSHGRSGLLRWIRGSVAERVLRASSAPLLLVTPHETTSAGFRRILVPLDGSDRAAAVLPLVVDLARRHEAEVVLLHVLPAGPPMAAIASGVESVELLRGHQRQLAEQGVTARMREALGSPAGEILDVAEREQADLIAMATHGRTGSSRFFLGSVAETVLRHARKPLLVVHTS